MYVGHEYQSPRLKDEEQLNYGTVGQSYVSTFVRGSGSNVGPLKVQTQGVSCPPGYGVVPSLVPKPECEVPE